MIDSKNTLLLTNAQLIYYTNMGSTLLIENVLLVIKQGRYIIRQRKKICHYIPKGNLYNIYG